MTNIKSIGRFATQASLRLDEHLYLALTFGGGDLNQKESARFYLESIGSSMQLAPCPLPVQSSGSSCLMR